MKRLILLALLASSLSAEAAKGESDNNHNNSLNNQSETLSNGDAQENTPDAVQENEGTNNIGGAAQQNPQVIENNINGGGNQNNIHNNVQLNPLPQGRFTALNNNLKKEIGKFLTTREAMRFPLNRQIVERANGVRRNDGIYQPLAYQQNLVFRGNRLTEKGLRRIFDAIQARANTQTPVLSLNLREARIGDGSIVLNDLFPFTQNLPANLTIDLGDNLILKGMTQNQLPLVVSLLERMTGFRNLSLEGFFQRQEDLNPTFNLIRTQANTQRPFLSLDLRGARLNNQPITIENLAPYANNLPNQLQINVNNLPDGLRINAVIENPYRENIRAMLLGQLARDPNRHLLLLSHMNHIKTLDLSENIINSEVATILANVLPRLHNLETLVLNGINRTNIGTNQITALMPALSQLQNLRDLDLSNNNIASNAAALADLGQIPHLRTLNLRNNNIGNAGLKTLANAFENMQDLRELDLSFCQINGVDAARTLANALHQLPNLERVVLRSENIDGELPQVQQGLNSLNQQFQNISNQMRLLNRGFGFEGKDIIRNALSGRNVQIEF